MISGRARATLTLAQILLETLNSLPTMPPVNRASSFSSTAGAEALAGAPAAATFLRRWLCATLQPVVAGRPQVLELLVSSGGIGILCRQLKAGPKSVAEHACGVLAAALRYDGRGVSGKSPVEEAAEVRAGEGVPVLALARVDLVVEAALVVVVGGGVSVGAVMGLAIQRHRNQDHAL